MKKKSIVSTAGCKNGLLVMFLLKALSLKDTSLSIFGSRDMLSGICFKILQKTKVVGKLGVCYIILSISTYA